MSENRKKLGLIINPVAGLGGRVGLKGSDGADIQQKALAMGAKPEASLRAGQSLKKLLPLQNQFDLITYPGEMGESVALETGFAPTVLGTIAAGQTTAVDTQTAAREMLAVGVDLLMFAGGDGTARDIYAAVGTDLPALGIPAGVKIHSAVYAANPTSAGELAALFLQDNVSSIQECEVMDLDEDGVRAGVVAPRLYGYLKIPYQRRLLQSLKSASPAGENAIVEAVAHHVIDHMEDDCLYIIGPGTTTRAITDALALPKTLIGVDVVLNKQIFAADVSELQLLELIKARPAKIVVTLIGGQGYVFGRGNQQISPRVIRQIGKKNLIIVSAPAKIHALENSPLRVDTGDPAVDEELKGYVQIVVGYNHTMVYKIGG
jgi:predicted polyphosphate/ATP-dependent NAD kinase